MAFLRAASMGVYGRVTDLSGRPLTKTRIVLDGRGEIRVNDKDARDAIQYCCEVLVQNSYVMNSLMILGNVEQAINEYLFQMIQQLA